MRVGFIGALRDVFLKRIERRRKIHLVDGVIRLLQQRRERIFLFCGAEAVAGVSPEPCG